MATVVVLGTLATFATVALVDTVDNYQKAAMQAQLHAELATALDRIARDMRAITLDPNEPGSVPYIAFFSNTTGVLWKDDADLTWGPFLTGDDLDYWSESASNLILDDVAAVTFTAYDEDDTQLGAVLVGAQLHPVRRLEVDLTMTRDGVTQSLRTKVFLREFVEGGD
jgi:hypothetical protein